MGQKTKFPFLFRAATVTSAAPSWPRPSCATNPRTLSFLDDTTDSFSSENLPDESAVFRSLRSDRLFFEPGETNSILEEAAKLTHDFLYRDGSVSVLVVDSTDPLSDFRASMEEMVEAHELKDWECLEELLSCYLRINGRSSHAYIIGAFVDLLLHLTPSSKPATIDGPRSSCSSSSNATLGSFTSPFSFSSSGRSSISPCLSSLENVDVDKNAR